MRTHRIPLTALATALVGAFAPAYGQEEAEDLRRLTKPQSTVELGVGIVSNEGLRFGQYNGLDDSQAYGLLDADVNRRDDASGTWTRLRGTNLGLENRGLRFEHER